MELNGLQHASANRSLFVFDVDWICGQRTTMIAERRFNFIDILYVNGIMNIVNPFKFFPNDV